VLSDVTPTLTVNGVGILTVFKRNRVGDVVDPSTLPIVSPFSNGDLQRVVFQDIFGTDQVENTRAAAMRIPAVARARNLIVSTICRLPLRLVTGQTPAPEQPSWTTFTGDGSSPQLRLAWTVDDLMFYGWSLWYRVRDDAGELLGCTRINYEDWTINDDNHVEIYGSEVADQDVIVFAGLHEGILSFGVDALADTQSLYSIVRQRLQNPVPQVDLHQTGGTPLTETEIDALIDRWAAARKGINGGVGFTSTNVEVNELNAADAQLMIEARNAAAVDMARLVGVAATRIDASGVNATLTYETKEGRNQELVDFDLALYLTPITARLSLDDITDPGDRVDVDLSDLIGPAGSVTGPNYGD